MSDSKQAFRRYPGYCRYGRPSCGKHDGAATTTRIVCRECWDAMVIYAQEMRANV